MSQNPESPTTEPTNIFINYRRADTSGHAGRLEQNLSQRFPGRVFMDIHTIEVGTDKFRKPNAEDFGELIDSDAYSDSVKTPAGSMDITPTVLSNGLKVTLKGDAVKRIFAHQPKKVILFSQRPKQNAEKEDLAQVKYLPN